MTNQRQPPQLIGLGPDSTPPGGTDVGSMEQRTLGGVVDIAGKVDALQVDVRRMDGRVAKLEMMAARMLDGYHEVLGIVSVLRTRSETTDVQIGAMMASSARIERRLGIVEHGPREGSSPALEEAARIGVKFAALHLDDEDTKVRERRDLMQHRAERRALLLLWARRAALVLGPLLTYLLTKYLGGSR